MTSSRAEHHDFNHHHSNHDHGDGHEDFDPGVMYGQKWVQDLVKKIQEYLRQNAFWLGIDPNKQQRILDYACGHGTISLALVNECPQSSFHGLDIHSKQVQRFNDESRELLKGDNGRMFAIEGDLNSPSEIVNASQWHNFDVAIISMALHHIAEPVRMLEQLRQRLRRGGSIVVVEFTQANEDDKDFSAVGKAHSGAMVEVIGGQKIWPDFTPRTLGSMLESAGYEVAEVRVVEGTIHVPDHVSGVLAGKAKNLIFAKALAP